MAPPEPGRQSGTRTFLAGFWLVKARTARWIGLLQPHGSESGQHLDRLGPQRAAGDLPGVRCWVQTRSANALAPRRSGLARVIVPAWRDQPFQGLIGERRHAIHDSVAVRLCDGLVVRPATSPAGMGC
jgi:hypothetical protein